MEDFLLDNLGWIIVVAFVLVLWGVITATKQGIERRQNLIQECLNDGRKRYECEAMFKEEKADTPVYIYIPR